MGMMKTRSDISFIGEEGFTDLDIQFGRFMERLSGKPDPDLFLAAALTSSLRNQGHICADLSLRAGKLVSPVSSGIQKYPELSLWLKHLKKTSVVGTPGDFYPLILDGNLLYLFRYWDYEKKVTDSIRERLSSQPAKRSNPGIKSGLERLFPNNNKKEVDWQKVAALVSLLKKFCVISGGPGTGKTRTVARILALFLEQAGSERKRIFLGAPTGKAAARLEEAVNEAKAGLPCAEAIKAAIPEEAFTIHRLLGAIPHLSTFRFNAQNPLAADLVIIDEASMVDLALFAKLIQAIPLSANLILLGDKDQLSSVEAGAILGDICDTGNTHHYSSALTEDVKKIGGENISSNMALGEKPGIQDSLVQLQKSYRFGETSGIGALSRAVNDGEFDRIMTLLKAGPYSDIHWQVLPGPDRLAMHLKERILQGFSAYFREEDPVKAFDLFNRFRILSPLREGPFGVRNLNLLVEALLRKEGLIRQDNRWYFGRPIMILRNDYTLKLFNGDVGLILPDPSLDHQPRAFFPSPDGTVRKYLPLRLPEHETVFVMTVHKSQGSEFEEILLLLPDKMSPVLTRELIYTGLTRAKQRVEIWGREEIFKIAVNRRIERTSGLRNALWGKSPK